MIFFLIIILMLISDNFDYVSNERRVSNGGEVKCKKPYMVYLTEVEPKKYKDWICGGALIHPSFILTSSACLEDTRRMYAIAGYEKYASDIDSNNCTKAKRKKVIFTYVPKSFRLRPYVEHWTSDDIGVAQVESPYDFGDTSYGSLCSYTPSKIDVNFDRRCETPNKNVIILGWGHEKYIDKGNKTYQNALSLQYTCSFIYEKTQCMKDFADTPEILPIIDEQMICTDVPYSVAGDCPAVRREPLDYARRHHGICQNDHGGPLVAKINGKETVIGVASMYRVGKSSECIGPYLFTSTAHFDWLIDCALDGRETIFPDSRRRYGYEIIKRSIIWNETDEIETNKSIIN